jgi:hypothetical protein
VLSKKYYIAVSRLIRESENLDQFVKEFVEFAKSENFRFSPTKFIKACEKVKQ